MNDLERQLVSRAQKDDVGSFETLVRTYHPKAYNIAYRMLGNEEEAKDASQDAFIKAYKSIKNFKGDSSFSTWMYRIVTNTCLDYIKKKKKQQTLSLDNNGDAVPIQVEDQCLQPDAIVEKKEMIKTIQTALNTLSEEHKSMIVLRDIQGFSYKEISEMTSCSEGTVKSRINRARLKLKDVLKDQMGTITTDQSSKY